jgi:hypothetical protein
MAWALGPCHRERVTNVLPARAARPPRVTGGGRSHSFRALGGAAPREANIWKRNVNITETTVKSSLHMLDEWLVKTLRVGEQLPRVAAPEVLRRRR